MQVANTHNKGVLSNTLIAPPGVVVSYVSTLLSDSEVRVDWLLPSDPITIITSYQVMYSKYEAVGNVESIILDCNVTSYIIQNLGTYLYKNLHDIVDNWL